MQCIEEEKDSFHISFQNHINEVSGQVEMLSEEVNILKEENDILKDSIGSLSKQLDRQKISSDSLKEQLQEAIHNEQEIRQDRIYTINYIISFRDQLFLQLGYAKAEHDEKGICIIEGTITVLSYVLRESGILILDNSGDYDSKSQYITGTVQTNNIDQNMQQLKRDTYLRAS